MRIQHRRVSCRPRHHGRACHGVQPDRARDRRAASLAAAFPVAPAAPSTSSWLLRAGGTEIIDLCRFSRACMSAWSTCCVRDWTILVLVHGRGRTTSSRDGLLEPRWIAGADRGPVPDPTARGTRPELDSVPGSASGAEATELRCDACLDTFPLAVSRGLVAGSITCALIVTCAGYRDRSCAAGIESCSKTHAATGLVAQTRQQRSPFHC